MAKYSLTRQADNDLEDIFVYSMEQWGLAQAAHYLRELERCIESLADGVFTGKSCARLIKGGEGLLYYHTNHHYIIYRKGNGSLEIIALYHDRMNLERHLSKL